MFVPVFPSHLSTALTSLSSSQTDAVRSTAPCCRAARAAADCPAVARPLTVWTERAELHPGTKAYERKDAEMGIVVRPLLPFLQTRRRAEHPRAHS